MGFSRRPAKKKGPESVLQGHMVTFLLLRGYEVVRFNSGAVSMEGKDEGKKVKRFLRFYIWFGRIGEKSSSGIADLLVVGKGDLFWVEVKTETGTIKSKQKDFATLCTQNGVGHVFARSVAMLEQFVNEREAERKQR